MTFHSHSASVLLLGFFLGGFLPPTGTALSQQEQKPEAPAKEEIMFKALKARSIGPALMGGRVSAIAMDPADSWTYYVGLGTGGVMKTADDGATFSPIFEKEHVAAIGAIAVAPGNPRQVWVGTGEANDRNSSSWGDGVYRSTDAGATWSNVGLKESKTIARIAVDPRDSNTAYVAAMGDLWTPGPGRGLFKTTDAGNSWNGVLAASGEGREVVGCGDVIIDPADPNTVYAVLYARRRTRWSFSAGPDATEGKDLGGLFKSSDAGRSWRKLERGLPPGTGRIGLDIFAANPKVVYAVIQSDEGGTTDLDELHSKSGGVFRSVDAGESWTRLSPLDPRPFYFSQIRVDPVNERRVYVLGFITHVSDDSGRTYQEEFFKNVHPDCHALAIDPKKPSHIVLGTDGGVYQSFNGGKSWIFLNTFAAGEFYRIAVDMSTPYRIAGGLQDNTCWLGPSRTFSGEGILNCNWVRIGGGDGFSCVFDPQDSAVVYSESQQGYVARHDLRSGASKVLRPEQEEGQPGFRFHWNAPFIGSVHEKGTMYLGGDRVFKLTDRGEHWIAISPDLSAHETAKFQTVGSGAENYGVVYTLAESPLKAGTLWAGTDDGKLWITRDGGAHWTDLSDHLPKQARGKWIGRVEPGHFDAGVAYMAVLGYTEGVYAPLAYRTTDGGESWVNVAGDLPGDGPVKVIREDMHNQDLLFAGTEFGLFVSTDRGKAWTTFGGLPVVAVDDIVIHPRDHDLMVATHGRSLYIVDDIQPLEEFTAVIGGKAAHLFTIRPAYGYVSNGGWEGSSGSGVYRGVNPPAGALLNYLVKDYTGDPVHISITDAAGRTVANLSGPGTPGFSRVSWDLKPTKDLLNDYSSEGQKFFPSGRYTATLSYGKMKEKQIFDVTIAPGIETR